LSIEITAHSVVGRFVTTQERVMVRARKPILTSFLFSRKRQKSYRYPLSPFADISYSNAKRWRLMVR
jgi:hypothetical protein